MSAAATDEVVYLDHNATTPVAPEVLEAMSPYLRSELGNPSSDHAFGRRARYAVDKARAQVAALIGAAPSEVVLTSGGTESNNLAIRGVAAQAPSARRRIVTSAVEHPAATAPSALLEASGWTLTRVPVAVSGILDLDAALAALGDDVALLTVMLAQNETGALMPVAELAAASHAHGAVVHTDAAQAIGEIPVSVDDHGPPRERRRSDRPAARRAVEGTVGEGGRDPPPHPRRCQLGEHAVRLVPRRPRHGRPRPVPPARGVHQVRLPRRRARPERHPPRDGRRTTGGTGAVRLTLGRDTTRAEIEAAFELLADARGALVATSPSPTSPSTGRGTPR